MKREELTAMGLTDEQIEKIIAENSKDVQAANAKANKNNAELERLQGIEKEFNAIKNAAKSYYKNDKSKPTKNTRFSLEEFSDPDPLNSYVDFADYKATIDKDRITLKHATSFDDSGQPLAYFYDDGRNPITAGHDYSASKYGVRINNASDYNPRIFPRHLHYSMPKAVPLTDPNVEVFKSGPFGITIKMNKSKLIRKYGK